MLFTDHIGNKIKLDTIPKKIISLVPSQTELLWDLGLRNELIGITKFCIHPKKMFDSKEKIGGTKTLNIAKIRALKPDLIIGNKEENDQVQILELQKEFNVWLSDIYNLADAFKMMKDLGKIVNKELAANEIVSKIENSFTQLKNKNNKSVLYFIWKKPYMVAGKATFIGDLLGKIGLTNVLNNNDLRYPELSLIEIKKLNPEVIFLSTEPYPFKEKHIEELQTIFPNSTIKLVDGELFSWYGSRLLKSVNYFNSL